MRKSIVRNDNTLGKKIDTIFGMTFFPIVKYLKYYYFRGNPSFIKIETTNFCNSQCLYCPNKSLKRKKGFMKDTLFEKIIKECVSWKIKEIHLCNFGEPLVDKKISEKLKLIKDLRPEIKTVIFTNGGLLYEKTCREIMLAGLDELCISFDGFSKNHFEKYRYPLKYELVLENIENSIKIKEELKTKTSIILQPVYDKNVIIPEKLSAFLSFWSDKVDDISIQKLHDWHGYVKNEGYVNKNIICRDLFEYMTINWDGSVVPCCLDYEGENILGNVNRQTIKQVWLGKEFTEFRRKLLRNVSSIPICSECKMRYYNFRYPHLSSLFWR